MNHSQELFPSTYECIVSHIAVGDFTQLDVLGSDTKQLDKRHINDVFFLDIFANILSTYQICHFGNGKIIDFSPNGVVIRELQNPNIVVAYGKVDHSSQLYKFVSFNYPSCPSFITHVYSLSSLWHEIFGHLNYKYLQQLRTQN
jgi:hypothetical protein